MQQQVAYVKRFLKIYQHMALVGIYRIIEELSYFYFRKIKFPSNFAVRSKVSLIIPVLAVGGSIIVLWLSVLAVQ